MGAVRPHAILAVWGCVSMALLTFAGNADNDLCDLKTDRVNRPGRPLAAGLLKSSQVRIVAFLLYTLAVVAAWCASPWHGALALFMAVLLLVYNRKLKGLPLIGNLTVALLCALAIYFPEFPSAIRFTLPAFVFAFLATFAREVVKDIEDVEGDRAAKLRTLPLVFGISATRKLVFTLVVLLLAMLPMPLIYFGYDWHYAILSLVLAGPFLIVLLVELAKSGANYGKCQRYLKWIMLGGMIALWVGVMGK